MKKIKLRDLLFTVTILVLIIIGCQSKTEKTDTKIDNDTNIPQAIEYDADLAKELNADDYGMKKYVMAFLKKGPNRDQDSTTVADLQRKHMDNINKMAEEGKLILAGPFLDDGDLRGIYIFNVESVEEAEELTNTDPAINAGRLSLELHPWYGSATIQKINELHKLVSKEEI